MGARPRLSAPAAAARRNVPRIWGPPPARPCGGAATLRTPPDARHHAWADLTADADTFADAAPAGQVPGAGGAEGPPRPHRASAHPPHSVNVSENDYGVPIVLSKMPSK
jgi:hypothetical protein